MLSSSDMAYLENKLAHIYCQQCGHVAERVTMWRTEGVVYVKVECHGAVDKRSIDPRILHEAESVSQVTMLKAFTKRAS